MALAVVLGGLIWASVLDPNRPEAASTGVGVPPAVTTESSASAVALADHLTAAGAVMYSAYWCPHCHEQKELFGKEASKALKVIECAPDGQNNQVDLCKSKGLTGFPSWEINGTIDSGVKSLDDLADESGYSGKREF